MFIFLVVIVLVMFLKFCFIAAVVEIVKKEEMKICDKNKDRHINEN